MSQVPTSDGRPDEPATSPSAAPYGLSYPCGEAPAPGQVLEVAPGVLWLRMPLPFALNHINLWAVADEDDQVLQKANYRIFRGAIKYRTSHLKSQFGCCPPEVSLKDLTNIHATRNPKRI